MVDKIYYCVHSPDITNLQTVESSDTKDVKSPGMDILRHVGVFPFLPLFVPAHHYQQGGEGEWQCEDRNFHLNLHRVKNSPQGLEIFTLLSVANSAFWMRIVEITLRIPANSDLL